MRRVENLEKKIGNLTQKTTYHNRAITEKLEQIALLQEMTDGQNVLAEYMNKTIQNLTFIVGQLRTDVNIAESKIDQIELQPGSV